MPSSRLLELAPHVDRAPPDRRPTILATLRLPIEAIVPPPEVRRLRDADDAELAALATSLRNHGQLQAIGVRSSADGTYELIFGQRRLEAARRAGFRDISATVLDADDDQVLVLALVENLHRRALSGSQRVQGLRLLAAVHRPGAQLGGHAGPQPGSTDDLCRRLGVSRHTLHRWLCLAHAPTLLESVEAGRLDFTAASLIATAPGDVQAGLQAEQERSPMPRRQLAERVLQLRQNTRTSATRTLQLALSSLEHIDHVLTDQERNLAERIVVEAQRLLEPQTAPARTLAALTGAVAALSGS